MTDWNEENSNRLRRMIEVEGYSASQAARAFGVSRGAITGRAARMKLKYRTAPSAKSPVWKDVPSAPTKKLKVLSNKQIVVDDSGMKPLPKIAAIETGVEPRDWETRQYGECAAIVKEVDGQAWSCCAPVEEGSRFPYCDKHMKRFFVPSTGKKALQRMARRFA